jgi:hypothetical protein
MPTIGFTGISRFTSQLQKTGKRRLANPHRGYGQLSGSHLIPPLLNDGFG